MSRWLLPAVCATLVSLTTITAAGTAGIASQSASGDGVVAPLTSADVLRPGAEHISFGIALSGQAKVAEAASRRDGSVFRVYKDSHAWFGENRDHATLLAMGKIPSTDYFVHPISACQSGIPADTDVVVFTSNGFGLSSATAAQNHPLCQAALVVFVLGGGRLIVDMGDNDVSGGFTAPGSAGSPRYTFPSPGDDATLAPEAVGRDGALGTLDDHPLVKGPDGQPRTADDLTNSNIDMCCFVAHGNLATGITLPAKATTLMTAQFEGVSRPVLAEYCLGAGHVILDTLTKEFGGWTPAGTGPSVFLQALFAYAQGSPSAGRGVPEGSRCAR